MPTLEDCRAEPRRDELGAQKLPGTGSIGQERRRCLVGQARLRLDRKYLERGVN